MQDKLGPGILIDKILNHITRIIFTAIFNHNELPLPIRTVDLKPDKDHGRRPGY